MIRVGIIGATGYAGAELVRLLAGHPDICLTVLTSRQYAGVKFDKVYPSMAGMLDLTCEVLDIEKVCKKADLFFLALPHKIPMELAPQFIAKGKRIIDLSADFRFSDVKRYESCYQPHSAQGLLKSSVYGLCEVYFNQIRNANLIGNPGCYPTSVLLPLIPLLKSKLVHPNSLIADSKSGVSGAGRSLSLTAHFCEVNESFKAYKVASHRHAPEMEEVLSRESGADIHITFVPHLVPMTRGMLTTIYTDLARDVRTEDIRDCIGSFYSGCPFVRIVPENRMPNTLNVRGSNFCDIGCKIDRANKRLIVISAIDNLVKGAAGQAVQNMNVMLGMDETKGLMNIPMPL
ncbi:N-acetyl-gamma-glutamyl-phosphate reductase [Desulfococcaceae bacterium HSG9]|nr:N-acetyl-gamma-glutamyl-phosphate reductase [Desulfococcaceae bacterium HSG9]